MIGTFIIMTSIYKWETEEHQGHSSSEWQSQGVAQLLKKVKFSLPCISTQNV